MDELKQIRTFIKVVDSGSFSAAARDISSVSSVARQVKALEDEFGATLLNRNSRRLSLTEAGQRLYERANGIVTDLDSVKAEIRSLQEEATGNLRVAMRVAAGATVVMPALPKLFAKYPDLVVDIMLTDQRLDLITNKIDVAMWMGVLPECDLIARRLTPTRRIVCGSPAYFAAYGTPNCPQDLHAHKCILYTAPTYGTTWTFTRGKERHEIEVHGNIRADNGLILLSAAQLNMGLIVVPEWMVRAHLNRRELVAVLTDYVVNPHPDHAELYAIYPSSRGMSRKVRVFVDFLIETFSHMNTEPSAVPRPDLLSAQPNS